MAKNLGCVLLGFMALVFLDYSLTSIGRALASYGPGFLPQIELSSLSSSGLSSVNFSIFDKGGSGPSYVTQGYGKTPYSYLYIGGWHNGIDIAARYGAQIYSPTAGTVIATGDQDDYCPRMAFGKFAVVDDTTNHLVLLFAHLGTIAVSPGETIKKNELIGTVGSTGLETGAHLHFSIFKEDEFSMAAAHGCGPYPQGNDVDPLNYLGSTYQ